MTTIIQRGPLRPVKLFDALDACTRDRDEREKCVLFDLHGYWWSVPMELTIHEVADAIAVELEQRELRSVPGSLGEIFRPKVA